MKNLKFILILSILLLQSVYSQFGTKSEMPLEIGNKWYYKVTKTGPGTTTIYYTLSEITKDTIALNKRYYYCTNFWGDSVNYFIGFNENTGTLIRFEDNYCNNEVELLKLKPSLNDSSGSCSQYPYYYENTIDTNIFGYSSKLKNYSKYAAVYYCVYSYVYRFLSNIGPYYKFNSSICRIGYTRKSELIGAVISGNVYGDTSFPVNTTQEQKPGNENITHEFSLMQNYPNPFNPLTSISFVIAEKSNVKLVIFNTAGAEIQTIFNGDLEKGTHSFVWDATSYPSGVYFYRLEAGDLSTSLRVRDTKKMVLIK